MKKITTHYKNISSCRIFIFLAFFSSANTFASDTLIWRSIPISSGKALTLGSTIDKLNEVTVQDGKRTFHLKKGTFAGADSICIQTDNKNCIQKVSFYYALTYTFEQHLEAMEKSLKKPESLLLKSNKKIATWRDNFSRFRLIIRTKKSKTIMFSVLEDL